MKIKMRIKTQIPRLKLKLLSSIEAVEEKKASDSQQRREESGRESGGERPKKEKEKEAEKEEEGEREWCFWMIVMTTMMMNEDVIRELRYGVMGEGDGDGDGDS